MVETLLTIATYASFIISGAVVALTAIAPLTKTEWDNKILSALVWFHDNVLAKVLPLHKVEAKPTLPSETK